MTNEVLKLAKDIGLPHWYQTDEVVNAELIVKFAAAIAAKERERIANQIDRMPFGDTAASFAVWIRAGAP